MTVCMGGRRSIVVLWRVHNTRMSTHGTYSQWIPLWCHHGYQAHWPQSHTAMTLQEWHFQMWHWPPHHHMNTYDWLEKARKAMRRLKSEVWYVRTYISIEMTVKCTGVYTQHKYMRLTIKDSCYIICSSFNCITVVCAIKEWVNFVAGGSWIREWLVWSTGCVEEWPEAERLLTSYLKGGVLDCMCGWEGDGDNESIGIHWVDWLTLTVGCCASAVGIYSCVWHR